MATDDARIQECVASFGGRALMTREDHPSGSDRLAEAAGLLNLAPEDIVINIQGDQPVFPPDLISQLSAVLRRDPGVVMVTPVKRVSDPAAAANPNTVKVVFDRAGRALYFSRSPLPFWRDGGHPSYYRHLGIYAYRVQFLKEFVHLPPGRWEAAEKLEQLRALEHGFPIHIVETDGDTREVDTPEDASAGGGFSPAAIVRLRPDSSTRSQAPAWERICSPSSAWAAHRNCLKCGFKLAPR